VTRLTPASTTGYVIKLVRDNTPDIINSSGEPGDLFYRQGEPMEVWPCLLAKVGEETTEFLLSQTTYELVDLYVAVKACADYMGVDLDDEAAKDERGGFSKGILMCGYHKEFDQ
jgi:predicted house-cleaning noncanonical NTP pyrophosphatase (MazG superfamily)